MASRLSEASRLSIYEHGHQGFLQLDPPSARLPTVDLKSLLQLPDPESAVQSLPPQTLYLSLRQSGIEENTELLPLISEEQWVRITDYDVWYQDALVPKQAFFWLNLYWDVEPVQMLERFRSLDEEYQIALLEKYIKLFDAEDFERMSEAQQDALTKFSGGDLYYCINTDEPEVYQAIERLVETALANDPAYAMTLFATAAYNPPNEAELTLSQFRKARLEEDGFISYEESLEHFVPVDLEALRTKWLAHPSSGASPITLDESSASEVAFLNQVMAHGQAHLWTSEEAQALEAGFLRLANALCEATGVESGDLSGLKLLLGYTKGLINTGLQHVSGGDVPKAAEILKTEYPKTLYRAGLSLVRKVQLVVVDALKLSQVPHVKQLETCFVQQKYAMTLDWFDKHMLSVWGHEQNEVIKALFNRFPMHLVAMPKAEDGVSRLYFAPVMNVGHVSKLLKEIHSFFARTKQPSQPQGDIYDYQ